jgi:hypothetical protein
MGRSQKTDHLVFSVGGAAATPSFNFTTPDKPAADAAPKPATTGFSFGSTASPAATGFTFGKKSDLNEPVKTGFGFGKTDATGTAASKPSFTFGASNAEAAKPSFGFGAGSDGAAKPPSFSFGGEKTDSTEKPKEAEKKAAEVTSQPPLMDLFKPKPGSWVCSVCDVTNGADKGECVACTTPKPGGAPAAAPAAKKWECP